MSKVEENQGTVIGTIWEAIEKDNVESLRKLVESGANLNDTNKEGQTLLRFAVSKNSVGSLKYLLESGCIEHPHCHYSPLLEYALEFPNMKVVKYLVEEKHAGSDGSIRIAVERNEFEVFKYLEEQGAPISVYGENSIFNSVVNHWGDGEAKYLIDKMKADDLNSALRWVASNGRIELVKYLVIKGAVANASPGESTPECLPLLKLASFLEDVCLLKAKTNADISILKELGAEELVLCAQNIMTNSLIKNGIPEHYQARFEAYSKVLPDFLRESLFSCFKDLSYMSNESLEVLEGALRFCLENLSPVPYSEIAKHAGLKITPEQQAVCEFYEKHPEYKKAGNYLVKMATSNSQLDIPVLRHLMLKHTDVAELAIQLNTYNIVPIELKQILHNITYRHTSSGYYEENKSLTIQAGQQERIEKLQEETGLLKEEVSNLKIQLVKICSFLNTMLGFEGSATDTNSAEVIPAIGELHSAVSTLDNPLD